MNKAYLITFLLAMTCLVVVSNSHAAKLYKWVDANGVISYQDKPPPANAKVLSETVVKDNPVQSTSTPPTTNETLDPVQVYTVEECELCLTLLTQLEQWGIPTQEKPLQDDREIQRKILATSDSISAPAIFIGDKILTNINKTMLVQALEAAGYQLNESSGAAAQNEDPEEQSDERLDAQQETQ